MEPWTKLSISISSGIRSRMARISARLSSLAYFVSGERYRANLDWYRAEISKCTYRQFTTGFYFGRPAGEAQIYDNSTYVNEYIYLGNIREVAGRGHLGKPHPYNLPGMGAALHRLPLPPFLPSG